MTAITEVAAAVILRGGQDEDDIPAEYLLARRPQGKVYAGYWEFPGGKVEAGETSREALVRELREELGIEVSHAWPWLSQEFIYPHAHVRLKFFKVTAWHGDITPLEHDDTAWIRIGDSPAVSPILPANGPILRALGLPPVYALTNAAENGVEAELARLDRALRRGLRLIQVRDKDLAPPLRRQFADTVMALANRHKNVTVLINDDESLARQVGAHGLHLSSPRLMAADARPDFPWVAASCHTDEELARAAGLHLDFALLSPVLSTPSHPETPGIGWDTFARRINVASLPVFALGGMTPQALDTARTHGAHGIAMLRGW